jgi:hypothetical protein
MNSKIFDIAFPAFCRSELFREWLASVEDSAAGRLATREENEAETRRQIRDYLDGDESKWDKSTKIYVAKVQSALDKGKL